MTITVDHTALIVYGIIFLLTCPGMVLLGFIKGFSTDSYEWCYIVALLSLAAALPIARDIHEGSVHEATVAAVKETYGMESLGNDIYRAQDGSLHTCKIAQNPDSTKILVCGDTEPTKIAR